MSSTVYYARCRHPLIDCFDFSVCSAAVVVARGPKLIAVFKCRSFRKEALDNTYIRLPPLSFLTSLPLSPPDCCIFSPDIRPSPSFTAAISAAKQYEKKARGGSSSLPQARYRDMKVEVPTQTPKSTTKREYQDEIGGPSRVRSPSRGRRFRLHIFSSW